MAFKIRNTDKLTIRVDKNGDYICTLKDVRILYEHVFKPWAGEDGGSPKFSGKFIAPNDTHAKEIEILQELNAHLTQEYFKVKKLKPDHYFFRDGDDENKEGFEDSWFVSASEKESNPPAVIDRDKTKLKASDDKVFSGSYVNVMFKPWKQDNKYGKKINANLLAVQHFRTGERLAGAGGVSKQDIDEGFDEYEADEMDEEEDGDGLD